MSGAAPAPSMTSNRPYLIRAIYQWIDDNGMTPYMLVDASHAGVRVPPGVVKEGKVVLNIAPRAVSQMDMGNQQIRFLARFSGQSQLIELPVTAVQAIYAQETGQGMMMPPEQAGASDSASTPDNVPPSIADEVPKRGAHLRVVK
ncbi:MAG: ClpXP protease specificity-enhancing factor [Lysobacteraceae bacterium]